MNYLKKLKMKKLINYFTPVGEDSKVFASALILVTAVILIIVFMFPLLSYFL